MPDDTVALNFHIARTLKDRVRDYGLRRGLSISAAVRLILTEAVERDEKRIRAR